MKTCTICGAEIVNGVNGSGMYDTCTDCRPIHYPAYQRPSWLSDYSYGASDDDDLRRAEDEYYNRLESYWDD